MLLPLYLWEVHAVGGFELTTHNLFLIGYAAVFPSFLCYILWNVAVPVAGPHLAALSQYTNPVFGVIFAILILGELPRPYHAVGIVAIIAGLYLSTLRRKANKE
jgi:drug/metabolite transporter (DMT)-like permease